jgi:hypothetical protein
MNKQIMRAIGFSEAVDLVENGKCPICSKEININDFHDALSLREYEISGMCISCQNEIFAEQDETDDYPYPTNGDFL